MTVSEAVISWLKQFEGDAKRKIKTVNTDVQGEDVYTYSLVKEPVQNVKRYLSGKAVYTDHYTIQARLPSAYDSERVANTSFGEQLEEWVRKQSMKGNFPQPDNADIKDVTITTPFFIGMMQDNSSIYQMTVAIKYERNHVL